MHESEFACLVRIKSTNFAMPPIHDALVLGKNSPIGCEALQKAMALLQATTFERITLAPDEDVVSDILVRTGLLNKIAKDKFVELILRRFKPLMQADECLHLDIDVEMQVEMQL
jgi:hypothetical protein